MFYIQKQYGSDTKNGQENCQKSKVRTQDKFFKEFHQSALSIRIPASVT